MNRSYRGISIADAPTPSLNQTWGEWCRSACYTTEKTPAELWADDEASPFLSERERGDVLYFMEAFADAAQVQA
jgi:hypothetical protein